MTTPGTDFYVYVLFRDDGRPFYVGKGHGDRWLDHERRARYGRKGHRFAIIRDLQARGVELAKVKLHEGLTEATANAYEVALIAAIGRVPHGPLVNLTDGGEGASGVKPSPEAIAKSAAARRGFKHSPEAIAKMAAAKRGGKQSLATRAKRSGWKHTPEAVAKIKATHLGRKHSPETRAKMAAAALGRKMSAEAIAKSAAANRGRKASPETRAKMAAAHRRQKAAA